MCVLNAAHNTTSIFSSPVRGGGSPLVIFSKCGVRRAALSAPPGQLQSAPAARPPPARHTLIQAQGLASASQAAAAARQASLQRARALRCLPRRCCSWMNIPTLEITLGPPHDRACRARRLLAPRQSRVAGKTLQGLHAVLWRPAATTEQQRMLAVASGQAKPAVV